MCSDRWVNLTLELALVPSASFSLLTANLWCNPNYLTIYSTLGSSLYIRSTIMSDSIYLVSVRLSMRNVANHRRSLSGKRLPRRRWRGVYNPVIRSTLLRRFQHQRTFWTTGCQDHSWLPFDQRFLVGAIHDPLAVVLWKLAINETSNSFSIPKSVEIAPHENVEIMEEDTEVHI